MNDSVITVEGHGPSVDSSERWQHFYEEYIAGDAVHRWQQWCLLTKKEREYFARRFRVDPPPPARGKLARAGG